jgi:hypothetical protein
LLAVSDNEDVRDPPPGAPADETIELASAACSQRDRGSEAGGWPIRAAVQDDRSKAIE